MQSILEEQASLELGVVSTNNILDLLECPVCLDHITPPIKQCVKGHLCCSDCFPRLPHCPTCRSPMSGERNLGMEQVSRLLNFPCRYHPMGCKASTPLSKKAEHERSCEFLQLKCPFHGQCSFSGALSMVVPHLKGEHAVTPVPVQPAGTLFYRAKGFYKRNLWAFIFEWDRNMFKLNIKHIHASNVGRTDNCNLVVAHVQYIGPDSMASQYAYQISLFDADRRKNGPKFEGVVSSTMKPLESQVAKEEVFVANTYTARDYTDQFGQLNFIIQMKSLKEKEKRSKDYESRRHRPHGSRSGGSGSSSSAAAAAPTSSAPPTQAAVVAPPAIAAAAAAVSTGTPTVALVTSTVTTTTTPAVPAALGGNSSTGASGSSTPAPSSSSSAPATSSSSTHSTTTTTDSSSSNIREHSPQPGPSHAP